MSEHPETPDHGDIVDPDEQAEKDEPIVHDPLGLDLASQIARATTTSLPPPRGVTPKKRRPRPAVFGEMRSGSGPDARDPQPLARALDKVIAQRGWKRELNVRLLLDQWPALVGATMAEHSTPEAYKDKVLTIRTSSTAWATQMRILAPSVVAQLNRELGDGTVLRIQVLGPSAPSWRHGGRTVRGAQGPRDTYG